MPFILCGFEYQLKFIKVLKPYTFLKYLICFNLILSSSFCFSSPNGAETDKKAGLARFEKRLFNKFGIRAINMSDQHSQKVLSNLLFLLDGAFTPHAIKSLKNFKFLYASAENDAFVDIAAFNPDELAIYVGGVAAYGDSDASIQIGLLAALAHEIGHAFLLQNLSPDELKTISEQFGRWSPVFSSNVSLPSLDSAAFFTPHPLYREAKASEPPVNGLESNLVTGYAVTSIHEWFADAFAAAALNKLGEAHLLGNEWRNSLVVTPTRKKEYWVNYNNLSYSFLRWFRRKVFSS